MPSAEAAGLIISHGADGPPGLLGRWLAERGIAYELVDISTAPVPPLGERSFVVSLGAVESARDDGVAWVPAELELLRTAIAAEVPVLGLCFGGQALSLALGGAVEHARPPQIGWFELSAADPAIPAGPWFHWHYEQLQVPPGGRELASSAAGPSAFRHGRHLGLQFHPEVTTEVIAAWSRSTGELAELGIDPRALRQESERRAAGAREQAVALFERWWQDTHDGA